MDRQGMSDMEMGTLATDMTAEEAEIGTAIPQKMVGTIDRQCQGIRPRLRHKKIPAVSE